MSKVSALSDFGKIKELPDLIRYLSTYIVDLNSTINGKIEFGPNILSQIQTTYFPSANTDFKITHTLNRTGLNFIVVNKTASTDIYHGVTADTSNTINLRSTVAGVTVTMIFV